MPYTGVKGFENDYSVSRHQVTKSETSSDGKGTDKICAQCNGQSASLVSLCTECKGQLCSKCTQAHKTMKIFQSHEIKDERTASDSVYCSKHPEKDIEFYCKTCLSVLCSRCLHASHKTHETTEIDSQTRKHVEGQMSDLVTKAQSKLSAAKEHLAYIEQIGKDARTRLEQIQTKIKTVFDSIIASRQKQLLDEAEQFCLIDRKKVWEQRDQVQRSIIGIEGALNFAERSQHCTENDLFICHGNHVIRCLKELNQTDLDLASTESFEMTTREFTHDGIPKLEDFGNVSETTNEPNLEIISFQPGTRHLHEKVQFEVKVVLKIGETQTKSKKRPKLKVSATHGHAAVALPRQPVTEECEDKWIVSFTPVVSGPHTLTMHSEINFGKQDRTKDETTVIKITGTPHIGDKVHCGPDWNYPQQAGQDDEQEEGKVIGYENSKKVLKVKWNGGNHEATYKWGEDGEYEVQMEH